MSRVMVITAEPEGIEATVRLDDVPAKKPAGKGRGKKGAASKDGADK